MTGWSGDRRRICGVPVHSLFLGTFSPQQLDYRPVCRGVAHLTLSLVSPGSMTPLGVDKPDLRNIHWTRPAWSQRRCGKCNTFLRALERPIPTYKKKPGLMLTRSGLTHCGPGTL